MKPLLAIVFCLITLSVWGQSFKVGDSVPDFSLTDKKLSDYPQKIVIIDFWSTWCGSCVAKIKSLEDLRYDNEAWLEIFLVNSLNTGEGKGDVLDFLSKWNRKNRYSLTLPVVVNDSIINNYFPHTRIPHYVWIKDSVVVGITGSGDVTQENINLVLSGNFIP